MRGSCMSHTRNKSLSQSPGIPEKDLDLFIQELPLLSTPQLDKLSMEVFAETMDREEGDSTIPTWDES